MNIALWVVAGLLAAAFLASGAKKLVRSNEELVAEGWSWAARFGPAAVNAIGVLEILAAVGLILPAAVDVAPVLVPLAALGLVLLMAAAAATHDARREAQPIAVTVTLLALAALVAWGRFGPESFTA